MVRSLIDTHTAGQTYTELTTCEIPSKFTQSTTKISSFTTVEGYMSVTDIKLAPGMWSPLLYLREY